MSDKVLIVGGGGREHAWAWKISQSPHVGRIFLAPGNGGTGKRWINLAIKAHEINRLVRFAKEEKISLTIVGPDDQLAAGMVDAFQKVGLRIFGPTKRAAIIESSKVFGKGLMRRAGIVTARARVFRSYTKALTFVARRGLPVVIKASGLALGKGVYVCHDLPAAQKAIYEIMVQKVHQRAGNEVIIEEYLDGPEVSIHALCSGRDFLLFPPARDHKTIYEGGLGPNTGGMGTIVPVPGFSQSLLKAVGNKIVGPALMEMEAAKRPFVGCLFPGLKMTNDGLATLEFNARFGDPETQSYVRLLRSDLYELINCAIDGQLAGTKIVWSRGYAVCVVLASKGYPSKYSVGLPIEGIFQAEEDADVVVFQAGTQLQQGKVITAGGRVLCVTAVAESLQQAREKAYLAVSRINFSGKVFRRDIGGEPLD